MTLVSSANNKGSDKEFNLRGRSFIYFMNKRGSRIDPRGKRVSTHPREKILNHVR
jgi:hypothetical protein